MKRALAPLLFLLLPLVACSGDDSSEPVQPRVESTQAESPEESPADSPAGDAQVVEAAGLRFQVPQDWTVVDPEEIADDAGSSEETEEVAARLNLSPEQFTELLRNVELYVLSDEADDGAFVDNINVTTVDEPLPTEAQVEQQYGLIGGEMTSYESLALDGQEAVLLAADITVEDNSYAVETLAVARDGGSVLVTVSAPEPAEARRVMADIVESADVL